MPDAYARTYRAHGPGVNAIDVSIEHERGVIDRRTGKPGPDGYYLTLQPLTRKGASTSFMPFPGYKTCVLRCKTASERSYTTARAMVDRLVEEHLDAFCLRQDIDVDDSEYEEREIATEN